MNKDFKKLNRQEKIEAIKAAINGDLSKFKIEPVMMRLPGTDKLLDMTKEENMIKLLKALR